MTFQEWVKQQFIELNGLFKELSTKSKKIDELEELDELTENSYVPVHETVQDKTLKYKLKNQDLSPYQIKEEKNNADGYVGLDSDSFINPDFIKGLKPHTPIQLTAGTPYEYTLPTNARLHALEIAAASSIIVGTATGLDDIGDYAPTVPSVWRLGFIIANSVFIQSDVDVIVEPIIFQK